MGTEFQGMLTSEQAEVAKLWGLQILTACPGAGKTRIVGARLSLLASEAKLSEGNGVAAITFTNAAANEIKNVYHKLTGKAITSPHYVGTIDSFVNRFLFQPFGHLALGDSTRKAELLQPNSNILNTIYRGYRYSQLHKVKSKSRYTYDAKGEITPHSQNEEIKNAVLEMKKDMKKRNLATISDASYWALILLRHNPQLCGILTRRFPFIMIDEAQDCSDVQMAIVDTLVESGHGEIMLIGDVFQAIYEFRKANPELLISKTNEQGWSSKILVHTHRCRKNIVKFINHISVADDPIKRQLISVKKDSIGTVRIIEENSPKEIANNFIKVCEEEDILPNINDVAILYGSHSSELSRDKVTHEEIEKLFATDKREKYITLPIAFRCMQLGRYADALREMMELIYLLRFDKTSHEVKREELDYESIEILRPRMWRFCKTLPDINLSLEEWVCESNKKLKELLIELDMDDTFVLKLSRRIGDKKAIDARSLLVGEGDYATGLPITVTNIHQVKGRTFKAVLLYLDAKNKKVSGEKLMKLLNGKKSFANMTEDDRCIYVAITRAEKLLCFAGDINKLRDWLVVNAN